MAVSIKCITVDCADPYRLSRFWADLTGFTEHPDNPNQPADDEALLVAPDGGPALLFVTVAEPKAVKNRLHLDLVPHGRSRDDEVARLLGRGARLVDDRRRPDGAGWVVLADPEGNEFCVERSDAERPAGVADLAVAFAAVGELISAVEPEQWSAPTPCPGWTVRRVIEHLTGLNRVFAALLADEPAPKRSADPVEPDPAGAYRESAARLLAAFGRPGVLERSYTGPLGAATGSERLQIRLYDLLAHGWDLAQATGRHLAVPDLLAEQALTFATRQLDEQARPGRFAPPRPVAPDATALQRLVAFLGRTTVQPPD